MEIKSTLSQKEKEKIVSVWNQEYPRELAYSSVHDYDAYLSKIEILNHYLIKKEGVIVAMASVFIREEDTWFSILINGKHQRRGLGRQLMNQLMCDYDRLNGWMVDQEGSTLATGKAYSIPASFYQKLGFVKLSKVNEKPVRCIHIQWDKRPVVLLDLGGVVFQSTGVSNDQIKWDIISRLNHVYGSMLNKGANAFPDFMKDYNDLSGQALSGDSFLRLVFDTLQFNKTLVDSLKTDYRIIIVSDNYRENITYISERYQFKNWSEAQFYSFDFELEKSDEAFFPKLLSDIWLKPGQTVLIDDSPHKLEMAEKAGIKPILFQEGKNIKKEVEAFFNNQSSTH